MANITWSAIGRTGHISYNDLLPRRSLEVHVINASYNDVKIYPSIVYIQNSGNDAPVQVDFGNGIIRLVAARTNQRLDIATTEKITLLNTGKNICKVLFLDKAGETESDLTLSTSETANLLNVNDFLFHFDTSSSLLTNSGIEQAFEINNVSGGVLSNITAKFGSGSMSYTANNDYTFIKCFSFFDLTKDFTIDFWINPSASTAVGSLLYFNNTNIPPLPAASGFGIRLASNVLPAGIGIFESGVFWPSPGTEIIAGVWNFVRCVNANRTLYLFANGNLVLTTKLNSPAVYDYMFIGACSGNSGCVFFCDEVRYSKGYVDPQPLIVPDGSYIT